MAEQVLGRGYPPGKEKYESMPFVRHQSARRTLACQSMEIMLSRAICATNQVSTMNCKICQSKYLGMKMQRDTALRNRPFFKKIELGRQ